MSSKKFKTFKDFLMEVDKDEILYVGTEKGSGWIDIAKASEIIESLDKLEKKLHSKMENFYRTAARRVRDLPRSMIDYQDKLLNPEIDDITRKKLEGRLAEFERSFCASYKSRNDSQKLLRNWKEIDERFVKDTYQHETDVIGTCVILEGIDNGTLWSIDEKKTKKK